LKTLEYTLFFLLIVFAIIGYQLKFNSCTRKGFAEYEFFTDSLKANQSYYKECIYTHYQDPLTYTYTCNYTEVVNE